MISDADRSLLLQVARDAIVAHVTGGSASNAGSQERNGSEILDRPGAVFVTIHNRGNLRGCIGHLPATEPLGRAIARCAVGACSGDPRFSAVVPSELLDVDIELS